MEIDKSTLAQLLQEAQQEHHKYEEKLGQADQDWAGWYASYVLDRLKK